MSRIVAKVDLAAVFDVSVAIGKTIVATLEDAAGSAAGGASVRSAVAERGAIEDVVELEASDRAGDEPGDDGDKDEPGAHDTPQHSGLRAREGASKGSGRIPIERVGIDDLLVQLGRRDLFLRSE